MAIEGLNFYNTVGGKQFIDCTMPAIKRSLISIEKMLSNMTLNQRKYTTIIKYNLDSLTIQSNDTTPDMIINIAHTTKESYNKWNDNTEKWLEAFQNSLPEDCVIISREITI